VDVDVAAFEALMAGMARMNGGTNIALAVQKAGQLLKPLGPDTHRVLVLLTDGRIDSHQVGQPEGECCSRGQRRLHCDMPRASAHYACCWPSVWRAPDGSPLTHAATLPPQSREARDMAARLADEQGNVRLHAYGVGRGVDKQELLRICAARDPASAEDRWGLQAACRGGLDTFMQGSISTVSKAARWLIRR
jgi:hypothetical protein